MSELSEFVKRASGIHRSITDDVVDKVGCGVLRCRCGEERKLTRKQIAPYFAHGWPKHCNATMSWVTAKQLPEANQ